MHKNKLVRPRPSLPDHWHKALGATAGWRGLQDPSVGQASPSALPAGRCQRTRRAPRPPIDVLPRTNNTHWFQGQRNEANLHTDRHVFTYANEAQLNTQMRQICKWGALGYAEGAILVCLSSGGVFRLPQGRLLVMSTAKTLTGTCHKLSLIVSSATFHRNLSHILPSRIIPILRQQR